MDDVTTAAAFSQLIASFVTQHALAPPTIHEAANALTGSLSTSAKYQPHALFGSLQDLHQKEVVARIQRLISTGSISIDSQFKLFVPESEFMSVSSVAASIGTKRQRAPEHDHVQRTAPAPRSGAAAAAPAVGPQQPGYRSSSGPLAQAMSRMDASSSSGSSGGSSRASAASENEMSWLATGMTASETAVACTRAATAPSTLAAAPSRPLLMANISRPCAPATTAAAASAASSSALRFESSSSAILIDDSFKSAMAAAAAESTDTIVLLSDDDDDAPLEVAPSAAAAASSPSAAAAAAAAPGALGAHDAPLAPEQKAVYDLVFQGHSVFFTGCAGSGKSHLLRVCVADLRERFTLQGKDDAVFVTAPTGIAACNIGGTTIHSWAGIGRGTDDAKKLAKDISNRANTAKRWLSARVLFIDEISMLDGALFDKLEEVARLVRRSPRPFGGLQIVACGDFLQLPPVEEKGGFGGGNRGGGVKFAFEAKSWDTVIGAQVALTQVFRQKDPRFVSLLNEVRAGVVSPATITALKDAGKEVLLQQQKGFKPTRIFAVNRDVDTLNAVELAKCVGEKADLMCVDDGSEPHLGALQKNCPAPERLTLKVGAQVMLLKNVDQEAGLVNGARGSVTSFASSLDGKAERAPNVTFERGAKEPLTVLLGREEWTTEMGGMRLATRSQYPLKLAWALSMHKAQVSARGSVCLDNCSNEQCDAPSGAYSCLFFTALNSNMRASLLSRVRLFLCVLVGKKAWPFRNVFSPACLCVSYVLCAGHGHPAAGGELGARFRIRPSVSKLGVVIFITRAHHDDVCLISPAATAATAFIPLTFSSDTSPCLAP